MKKVKSKIIAILILMIIICSYGIQIYATGAEIIEDNTQDISNDENQNNENKNEVLQKDANNVNEQSEQNDNETLKSQGLNKQENMKANTSSEINVAPMQATAATTGTITHIGTMNLESPVKSSVYTKPDDAVINLKGWALSTDIDAKIKVYVNGAYLEGLAIDRVVRADVHKVYGNTYGGTSTTPSPGFKAQIPLDDLSQGTHIITVEQVDKNGNIISLATSQITIKNKNYSGAMYIESPAMSKEYTKPDDTTINLKGWAISTDSGANLKVYIDGAYWSGLEINRSARGDVHKAYGNTYGGTTTTPNPGFNANISLSGLSVGTHTIKVEYVDRNENVIISSETKINVKHNENLGKMYIESPINDSTLDISGNSYVNLKGWALSSKSNTILKVYVNGVYLEDLLIDRVARGDVHKVYGNTYGGTATTPNPGFKAQIDITKFNKGVNTITVEQVYDNDILISSSTVKVTIKPNTYSGTMYIESPTMSKEYIKPDDTIINLKGWAISTDPGAKLKVYIDGAYWSGLDINRTARGDVHKAYGNTYGGATTTPSPGFNTNISLSGLSVGTHTIKVEYVDKDGNVLTSSQTKVAIKNKVYTGKMYIDSPTASKEYVKPDDTIVNMRGWAISTDLNAILRVYVNGVYCPDTQIKRTARGDVNKAYGNTYGGTETTPLAGFEAQVDISKFDKGTVTLRVEEIDRNGNVIASSETKVIIKNKVYSGKMYIESPVANSTVNVSDYNSYITLKGWAISTDSEATLRVYINDKLYSDSGISRAARGDVNKAYGNTYGGTETTPQAGFSGQIPTSALKEGKCVIKVEQVSRFGEVISVTTSEVNIFTPLYASEMWIDKPINYQRMQTGLLDIKGWAVSFDTKSETIKIYIDGNYITNARRESRPDVDKAKSPSYGGVGINSRAGFYSLVPTDGLSEGLHTLRIDVVSSFGKTLNSKSVHFIISNSTSFGVDVSHWNGNVNWAQLSASGVQFAILKIGQYSESRGVFTPDPKFEANYAACKSLGIKVGGYLYSYAFNADEAYREAVACLNYIKGKSFDFPIFMDIEDPIVVNAFIAGTTNRTALTQACQTFCNTIMGSGYKAGIYSYKNFLETYLHMDSLQNNYNIWLAHFTNATNYAGKYDIWQFSSEGKLAGNGSEFIDLNYCYTKY